MRAVSRATQNYMSKVVRVTEMLIYISSYINIKHANASVEQIKIKLHEKKCDKYIKKKTEFSEINYERKILIILYRILILTH